MESQQYMGLSGNTYQLQENPIAGGGEGSIYKIVNHPYQVAKIFKKDRRTRSREDKLRKMVGIQLSQEQLSQVMWPQDVIYTKEGFAGYIMPMLKHNKNLNVVYSTNEANLTFRHRILIAYNLCVAVNTIHSLGQVCGDLNPQNICVNLDLTQKNAFQVTLVDADSYHFLDRTSGTTHRCEVGLSEYIAPEIQKKLTGGLNLKNAPLPTYTRETDLFALAVHIFALLMNGSHPFACAEDKEGRIINQMQQMTSAVQESIVLPQPIENIKSGFFPFHQQRPNITYPLYAPSFDSLPSNIQALFVRTFEEGYVNPQRRVTAEEWMLALRQFATSGQLVQCPKNHWYSSHMGQACPWCAAQERFARAIRGTSSGGFGAGGIPPTSSGNIGWSNISTSSGGNGTSASVSGPIPPIEFTHQPGGLSKLWGVINWLCCFVMWCVSYGMLEDGTFLTLYSVSEFGLQEFPMVVPTVILIFASMTCAIFWGTQKKFRKYSKLWGFLWLFAMVEYGEIPYIDVREIAAIIFLITSFGLFFHKKYD